MCLAFAIIMTLLSLASFIGGGSAWWNGVICALVTVVAYAFCYLIKKEAGNNQVVAYA